MNMPGGPLDEIRDVDPRMVEIVPVEKHRLSAFAGPMSSRFAKIAETNGVGGN
jgi:hypothetical protein